MILQITLYDVFVLVVSPFTHSIAVCVFVDGWYCWISSLLVWVYYVLLYVLFLLLLLLLFLSMLPIMCTYIYTLHHHWIFGVYFRLLTVPCYPICPLLHCYFQWCYCHRITLTSIVVAIITVIAIIFCDLWIWSNLTLMFSLIADWRNCRLMKGYV